MNGNSVFRVAVAVVFVWLVFLLFFSIIFRGRPTVMSAVCCFFLSFAIIEAFTNGNSAT